MSSNWIIIRKIWVLAMQNGFASNQLTRETGSDGRLPSCLPRDPSGWAPRCPGMSGRRPD
eukprot:scaffold391519_cov17-Prasinocladus_malaysianus.AAC.1